MRLRRRQPYVHPKFGTCWSSSPYSMPHVFDELAQYNTRVVRGIVHTPEYVERMTRLQAEFYEWQKETQPGVSWPPDYTNPAKTWLAGTWIGRLDDEGKDR